MLHIHTSCLFLALLLALPSVTYANPHQTEAILNDGKTFTISDVLALALKKNPSLRESSWNIEANEARLVQAAVLPNPSLQFEREDFAGSGRFSNSDQAQTMLVLSQPIELGGDRAAREDIANHQIKQANWNYQLKQNSVIAHATINFFHVAADQEKLRLAREATKLARAMLKNIKSRVKAGKSSILQEKNAQVVLAQYEIEEEHAEHELKSAKVRLAATWGAKVVRFKEVHAKLFQRVHIPSYEKLAAQLPTNPKIKKILSEQQIWSAKTELAKANRIPNITIGVGIRRYEAPEEHAAVVQMSIPLPLFNRNNGRIEETIALHEKSKAEQRNAETELNQLLFGLYQELHHAKTEMEKSETHILIFAKQALQLAEEGFKLGRFSYLEFSDAQRTFVDAKKDYIHSALEFHQCKAEIEHLIGSPLNGPSSENKVIAIHTTGNEQ
jgi:cobalt-zinc-cadmium efflux system outer membrane protein